MKILLLETIHDEAVELLERAGELQLAESFDAESVARRRDPQPVALAEPVHAQ